MCIKLQVLKNPNPVADLFNGEDELRKEEKPERHRHQENDDVPQVEPYPLQPREDDISNQKTGHTSRNFESGRLVKFLRLHMI